MILDMEEGDVRKIFEKISGKYDLANELISFFQHKKWRKDALERLAIKKGANALDLCCGTGDWTIPIAREIGPQGKVYGIDFSGKMLERAGHKLKRSGLKNVVLLNGNVKMLPFDDGRFDYATIGFGLRNVSNYEQVLEEVKRVLKGGGKIAVLETSKPSMPFMMPFYLYYLRFFVPLLGALLAGSFKEYYWLYKSTMAFPDKEALAEMLVEAGFSNVHYRSYWGGVAAAHYGTKR